MYYIIDNEVNNYKKNAKNKSNNRASIQKVQEGFLALIDCSISQVIQEKSQHCEKDKSEPGPAIQIQIDEVVTNEKQRCRYQTQKE